jgi:hypothetical protein
MLSHSFFQPLFSLNNKSDVIWQLTIMKAQDLSFPTRSFLSQFDVYVRRYRRPKAGNDSSQSTRLARESVDTVKRSLSPPHISARPSSPAAQQDSLIQQSAVRREPHVSAAQARPLRDRTASFSSQLCAESRTFQRAQASRCATESHTFQPPWAFSVRMKKGEKKSLGTWFPSASVMKTEEQSDGKVTICLFYQYVRPLWTETKRTEAIKFVEEVARQLNVSQR